MKEVLKTAMMTSISEVLETMFFMTIETSEAWEWADVSDDLTSKNRLSSRIDFSGPLSGFFILTIPKSILLEMTEIFMGMEADKIAEPHLSGTVSEAINIIAGNTFSNFDDQAVFNLNIPELLDAQALSQAVGHPDNEAIFIRIETSRGHLGLQVYYSI